MIIVHKGQGKDINMNCSSTLNKLSQKLYSLHIKVYTCGCATPTGKKIELFSSSLGKQIWFSFNNYIYIILVSTKPSNFTLQYI